MHRLAETMLPRRVWPLVGWTVFVWGSRIRNIWADADLESGGQLARTALSLSFLILALVVAWLLWSNCGSAIGGTAKTFVYGLALWTAGVWLVRTTQILLADHDVGFKAVHVVLAVVSIALASYAVGRSASRSR